MYPSEVVEVVKLAYVESWHVIQEANRIFGFDGWSSETIEAGLVADDPKCVSYIAKSRYCRKCYREGYGSGHGRMGNIGDKHESAIKRSGI